VISKATAERFVWGGTCDGWHLARGEDLSVAQEVMPPGTSEERHYHARVRQFFFVLSGEATLELAGSVERLRAQEGLEVAPGLPHQMRNDSAEALEFLVISSGLSRNDRFPA
jgi:mannose-6-phosphate isomerase-like protein (cupin superfamily)